MSDLNTTVTTPAEETASQQERTFTQKELDEIVRDRLAREKGKYADYEELKAKAIKFDEVEESQKSELQKATERAEKLQSELDSIRKTQSLREMREKVAKESGVPLASMSLITGETEEACKEQAQAILSIAQPASYPSIPDGGEVQTTNKGSARESFKEWANQMNN